MPGRIARMDACILNRIAQLLSGDGATEIDYKGARLVGVEEHMRLATRAQT